MHFIILSFGNLDVTSLFKTAPISSNSLDFQGIWFLCLHLPTISLPLLENSLLSSTLSHQSIIFALVFPYLSTFFCFSVLCTYPSTHNYLNCYTFEVCKKHSDMFQTLRNDPTIWETEWVSGCINGSTKAIALTGTGPTFCRVCGRKVNLLNVINFLPSFFLFIPSSSLTITFLTSKRIST